MSAECGEMKNLCAHSLVTIKGLADRGACALVQHVLTSSTPTEVKHVLTSSTPTEVEHVLIRSTPTEVEYVLTSSTPTEVEHVLTSSTPTEVEHVLTISTPTEVGVKFDKRAPTVELGYATWTVVRHVPKFDQKDLIFFHDLRIFL